jgi:biphenyl 2,3-dioxygenase beta subunit
MSVPVAREVPLRSQFEEILYREAYLLDNGRLDEWIGLLHEDIRYWAPVRTDLDREEEDFNTPYLMAHFDDDFAGLKMRARRVEMGLGYTDQPKARTRHLITNVIVSLRDDGSVAVTSNFLVFRSHVGLPDHYVTGCRNDQWVEDGDWKLKERQVIVDRLTIEGMAVLF